MFRSAIAIASTFTLPVVLSRKTADGTCSCSIGSYVVINDEGWIVTAGHIANQFATLDQADKKAREKEARTAEIRGKNDISEKEKREQLKALGKTKPQDTVRGSAWWSRPNVSLREFYAIDGADIAIGRLEPFDPN